MVLAVLFLGGSAGVGRTMKIFLAAVVLMVLPTAGALAQSPGSLDGSWSFQYSCADTTGVYADRCAAGVRDYFNLSIVQGAAGSAARTI